jgi:hypothetical protein
MMAWRMLMTPILPAAAEPAVAGDCAQAAAALKMNAAASATVRVDTFRDRKAVNVFCDRKAVNNLEFTFFSLLWSAPVRPRRTCAKSAWPKIDSAPSGLYERIANLKV